MKNELLDDESISNHQVDKSISNGSSFDNRMIFFGVGMLIFGVLALSGGNAGFILGPILLLAGGFILTSQQGVDLSLSTNYFREYHQRFFLFKSGKWLPLSAFSDICVLKIGRSKTVGDLTGTVTTDLDASKNEVFLMTHDHRKRLLIKSCNSFKEADQFAKNLAEELGKNYTKYNPKLTEKTRQRLSRRR